MFGPSRQRRHGDAAERADDGSSRRLSVAILGPGGVGGVLAAVLSRAGHDVVCIAHRETAQDIQRHGIGVTSEYFGTFTASTIRADVRLRDRVDVCIVAVKAYSLQPALRRVPPQDLGTALVVPFLNGIEHTGYLRRRYPAASVIAGTIRIESRRVAPTEIIHSSPFASIGLSVTGDRPGLLHRTRELASQLGFAGFPVEIARKRKFVLLDMLSFPRSCALHIVVRRRSE